MISFACPHCGQAVPVPDDAGERGQCPGCGKAFALPAAGAPPPPDASAPTVAAGEAGPGRPPDASSAHETVAAGVVPPCELTEFLAPPQAPGEIGRLGPYRVLRVLGAGGMGVVFQAEDPVLGRPVALKAILPSLGASATARQRFLREARTAAAIKNDHIVHIYHVGEAPHPRSSDAAPLPGVPFLAMEYLEGESLDDRLKREARLPVAEAVRIGRETALGLAAAHERGLVHRDVKPANLWLDAAAGDRVKILDFGLARPTTGEQNLTQSGAIVGTPAYMAPEQARARPIDSRADLFSLGVLLYRLTTGELPFRGGDMMSTLTALAVDEPPPPRAVNPDLPPELSDLVMRLLVKDPERRNISAREVAAALQRIEQGLTSGGPPPPAAPQRRRPGGRVRGLLLAAGVVVPLVAAGLYLLLVAVSLYFGPGLFRGVPATPPAETPHTTVNLLPLIDLTRDTVRGEWLVHEGELRAEKGASHDVLEFPYVPPEEYDLRVEFTRVSGDGDVDLVLNKGGHSFKWCAALGDRFYGFELVGGKSVRERPGLADLPGAIRNGHRHVAVVQVRRGGLKAFLDQRLVNELVTDGSDLGMFPFTRLRDERLLGLVTFRSPCFFHKVEVVEVSGPGTLTRSEAPGSAPLNLLAVIDPRRDAVSDTWGFNEKGELISGLGGGARLQIPYRPPAEYDLRIAFTRSHGDDALKPILIGSGRQFQYVIGGSHNKVCGFEVLSGEPADTNPTTSKREAWLQNFRRHEAVFRVRRGGVKVLLDGEQIADPKTDFSNLRLGQMSPNREDMTVLRLETSASRFVFHKLEVVEVSGAGSWPAAGWVSLFNGKDLTGWEKVGKGDWVVEDNLLRATGTDSPGWLATERDYGDFELELEYRLGPKGNSGVFVHAWKDGAPNGGQFLEVQLIDDKAYDTVGKPNGTAAIFEVVAAKPAVPTIPNTWYQVRIRSVGRRLQVSWGDQQVIDANLDDYPQAFERFPGLKRTSGRIGLQHYGTPVEFRKIRLRRLSP